MSGEYVNCAYCNKGVKNIKSHWISCPKKILHDRLEAERKEALIREKDLENKRLTDLLKMAEKSTTIVMNSTTTNEYHYTDNSVENNNSNNTTNVTLLIESPVFEQFQQCLVEFNNRQLGQYISRGIEGLKQYQIDLARAILSSNNPEFIRIGEALVDDGKNTYADMETYRQEMRSHLFDTFVSAKPETREPVIKLLTNEPLLKIL